MKYKFVRFKNKATGQEYKEWYFATRSREQVIEHSEKVLKPLMQAGFDDRSSQSVQAIFRHGTPNAFRVHPTSPAAVAIDAVTHLKYNTYAPLALFETANSLYLECSQNRIKEVLSGKEIYLANGVRQFGYSSKSNDIYEIAETVEKDKLEYPDQVKFKLEDARYIQWPGGEHWYVKFGNIDVVVDGKQKWNSRLEAEEATKKFYDNELR